MFRLIETESTRPSSAGSVRRWRNVNTPTSIGPAAAPTSINPIARPAQAEFSRNRPCRERRSPACRAPSPRALVRQCVDGRRSRRRCHRRDRGRPRAGLRRPRPCRLENCRAANHRHHDDQDAPRDLIQRIGHRESAQCAVSHDTQHAAPRLHQQRPQTRQWPRGRRMRAHAQCRCRVGDAIMPRASVGPPNPTIAPANAGPPMSVTPWIAVSRAFARSSAVTGTRRGSNARIPAMVSGLVSENTPTSASSTGAVAQPRRSTAISAITHAGTRCHVDGDRPDRTNRVDQRAGDRTDRQSWRDSGKRQPSCQYRRASPRQRVQHDRQREHAPGQSRQQRGDQQRPHVGRAEKLAVRERYPCHGAERSGPGRDPGSVPIEYAL